jgi:hypothetical protein
MIQAKLIGFQEQADPHKLPLPLVNFESGGKIMTEVFDQKKHKLCINDLEVIADKMLECGIFKLESMID